MSLNPYRELIKCKELNALQSQEIIALKERIKQLKEAGDKLAEYISPSAIGFTPSVIENWQKIRI